MVLDQGYSHTEASRSVGIGDGAHGFIDMLWKGMLLVEHKSGGLSLDRAAKQAFDYFPGISEDDLPG
ncbi:type IIL restriction-modification enzyme MmeI [Janthinobacterium sp. Ant5-2-1]|uniref:type IIL restriction-modification enzyme MmeI n=1 Tax=Janthinobacterium sp. Ant5-2-1 TaxID=1755239 RepID=UPI002AA2ACF0|nr:type IIL restriction-modification enzyme MmeI [Janthinobacterium sp. Ant5-2-1]